MVKSALLSGKKKWAYLLAFGIPFVIYLVILMVNDVYPFGENCILHVDMYHQYCPFFTEFMEKLKSGDSLLYSWNVGLGSDFVALYAYYLASPLNWLILLCPDACVIEFMTLLIVLKVAGAGLTMFYYLKEHFHLVGRDGHYHVMTFAPALVFGTAYAFSGYIAAYYWDIMWLDCVLLFPLIVLGLERLVKEKRPALYYVTLAVSILSNYYISIMICIFLVFYFLVLCFENRKGFLRKCGRFFLYSLLAGGTGAVLLIPEIQMLSYSGSDFTGFPEAVEWYFDLISELVRSCVMTEVYTGTEHWPNLYAGCFTLLLAVLYLLNRRIPVKKRILRFLAIVFFWVSFSNNYLDFIWHGLHFPSSLPARQSFFYIFLLLVLGFEALRLWKGISAWNLLLAVTLCLMALALGKFYGTAEGVTDQALLLTALLIVAYALLMVLIKNATANKRRTLCLLFCGIALAELVVNMAATGTYTVSRAAYVSKQEAYDQLLETAEADSDGDFYRVEDTERKTKNDSSLYGYSSATTFSSLMNIYVGRLYQSVRMEGGKNFYSYNGATPLWTAMLSVKYYISDCREADSALRTLVAEADGYYLYENNYYLSLGFMLPSGLSDAWDNSSSDKIANLNGLAQLLGAETDMLKASGTVSSNSSGLAEVTIEEEGYYYANYTGCTSSSLTISNPNSGATTYSKASHKYLLELGYAQAGQTITIKSSAAETIDYTIYKLDLDALDQAYDTLSEQVMELEEYSSTEISGTIDVKEAGDLFFSIPAEEGWTLYVDGEETEWTTFKDAFITVSLSEGTHEIRLVYQTPGLMLGGLISVLCVLIFAGSMCITRKMKSRSA